MADISLQPDLENEEGGRRRREKKKSKEISVFKPGASCETGDDESTTNQRAATVTQRARDGEPTTQRGKLGFAFLNFGRVCCVYS